MRISIRDKRIFYYSLYTGKTEQTETIGTGQNAQTIKLGEYTLSYTDPQAWLGYVSTPRGTASASSGIAKVRPYGLESEYRRYIWVEGSEGIPSLDIDSVLWIDVTPDFDAETGKPKPYAQQTVKPDYRVTRIAHSLSDTMYEIKEY